MLLFGSSFTFPDTGNNFLAGGIVSFYYRCLEVMTAQMNYVFVRSADETGFVE